MNTTINTNERIFRVETFENEIHLCNLDGLKHDRDLKTIDGDAVKSIKHYWNNKFSTISKLYVKQMLNKTEKENV